MSPSSRMNFCFSIFLVELQSGGRFVCWNTKFYTLLNERNLQVFEVEAKFVKLWFGVLRSYLRGDLGAGGAGPVTVHPHPVLGQKLLQVHVLQLEQASVTRQGPLPQQRPQESWLGVGPQCAGARGPSRPAGPSGTDTHRVFVWIQGLVFVWRGGRTKRLLLLRGCVVLSTIMGFSS